MPHETTHRFLASELPVAEPESCLFHVLPVPLEATVSYAGGTARGPEAILEASDQLELWDGESVPAEAGIYTWPAVDISGSPETVLGRVEAAVGGILDCNGLPVLLGGEHTVTYGALAALKKRFGTFGIIQFDAHADLRDSYEGSPWSHACVMRRAVKDLGLPLAQFGVRAMCLDEVEARKEHGVTFHDAASIARSGLPESLLPLTWTASIRRSCPRRGRPSLAGSAGISRSTLRNGRCPDGMSSGSTSWSWLRCPECTLPISPPPALHTPSWGS